MRKTVLLACILAGLVFLAGCWGEERRGNKCHTDAECSWCDDYFLHHGRCEEGRSDEKDCTFATTTDCRRALSGPATCQVVGGVPNCVESTDESQPSRGDSGASGKPCRDNSDCGSCAGTVRYSGKCRNQAKVPNRYDFRCEPGLPEDCAAYGEGAKCVSIEGFPTCQLADGSFPSIGAD
jgi:hypothetical protein